MVNITKQTFSEVNDVLNHMDDELYNQIPKKFIKLIKNNMDENYKVSIDYSKGINNVDLSKETRLVLALIYRDYICDDNERKELIESEQHELRKIEQELREKYNPDNIFKKQKNKEENTEEIKESTEENQTNMTIYKESIFIRIINMIKRVFRK